MTNPNDTAIGHGSENGHCCGLTKREYFAAMAPVTTQLIDWAENGKGYTYGQWVAKRKVEFADALIAELNKETK